MELNYFILNYINTYYQLDQLLIKFQYLNMFIYLNHKEL
jgi:hypothetical protein